MGGIFAIAFSVVAVSLVLFILPSACSVVTGFELLFLGVLLIIGLSIFISGLILTRRGF